MATLPLAIQNHERIVVITSRKPRAFSKLKKRWVDYLILLFVLAAAGLLLFLHFTSH